MSNIISDPSFMGKPITRPMGELRKHPKFTDLKKLNSGEITDLSGNHRVKLQWHMNELATRDKIFKLTVGENEVYLDLEELLYYTRVF